LQVNTFPMGSLLALAEGMRTLGLLITLLAASPQAATDQKLVVPEGTIIASAQVTGFDVNRLSPGLRQEITDLAGTPLNDQRLDELRARIEGERPRYVAAVRTVMEADGKARVFFVVGRRADPDRDSNVNDRYIIERATIVGVPDAEVSEALRDDLQTLVGKRLDSSEAQEFQRRIERELPHYEVARRIERGSEPGRLKLVYEATKQELPQWLHFEPLQVNAIFHSEQGWGSYLDLGIGDRNIRFTPIVAIDNADDLVEEFSGAGLRFETRTLGTRRLGASFEWTWFEHDWRDPTLTALAFRPDIPAPYDTRTTITPLMKFALSPELSVAGGMSIAELKPFAPAIDTRMANAAVASIDYSGRWGTRSNGAHRVDARFGVRAGYEELESDLEYKRYLGQGSYRFDFGRHHIQATGMAGGITGQAPLFERFTLGDSKTLRGWDKYDIAPAGGDRMLYSSIEYRYTGLALFLDAGSVWDEANGEKRVRVSTGFGLHAGPVFLVVGFPLNTDDLKAVVTLGLRIPGVGLRW
jgi:hypothetical protein